jgi:AcrR family transcriptional regulator
MTEPPRMRVDAARNRSLVLAAAREVFVEQGVDAPLEEVARRAGVGIATLYRRFPDRSTLIRGVALDLLARVTAEARAVLAEEPDGVRALSRYLHRSLDLRIAALMPVFDGRLDLAGDDELRAARDGLTPLFREIVDRARAAGLRPQVGLGDIGLMVIRLARPLPSRFPRDFDDAAAHRQLDVMLAGMFAPSDAVPGVGLSIEDLRRGGVAGG